MPRAQAEATHTTDSGASSGPGTLAVSSSLLFLFLPLENGLATALPKMVVKGIT